LSISNYAELKILASVFTSAAYQVATPYVSLHDSDPLEVGGGEITSAGGSYSRQLGTFASPGSGETHNQSALTWTNMPARTISHIGVWDSLTAGNFLWGGAMNTPKTTNAGDTFQINSSSLSATLD